tara:strand:+ start:5703 stop:6818 length:1116 start_codon:yes stop_codon:yes gene_type:complete
MSDTPFRILVIGSVTIDNIAVVATQDIERITRHDEGKSYLLLEQGRKIDAENISHHVGGGAANVAISMARQGFDIDILALVGDDHNGKKIRQTLSDEGIGLDHFITEPNSETGSSILIYSHDQNAAIFTHRGANTCLTRYLDKIDFSNYQLVYVGCLSGNAHRGFPEIVRRAKEAGCYVATNPGVSQLTDHIDEFLSVAHEIDYLSLNKVETVALLSQLAPSHNNSSNIHTIDVERRPLLMETGLHVGECWLPLKDAIETICHAGPTYFSLTDGTEGAYLFDGKTLLYCPSNDVTPWGTAGAGDAFASTIVAQLVSGYGPERALYAATRNAGSVVEHVDTQTGLLTAAAINQIAMDSPPSDHVLLLGKRSQ